MMKPASRFIIFALAVASQIIPVQLVAAELEGVLDWTRKVKLGTTVTGVVANVYVNAGDKVKANDILVALDDRVLKANVEKAKAGLEARIRLHDEAERELERNNELYDRTVLSEHELETARIGFASAVASLKSAEAAKTRAEVDLQRSQIRAPFDGIVIERHAEVGQTIISEQQADTLVVLAEAGKMMVNVLTPIASVNKLKPGQTLPVKIGPSKYPGKIITIGFEPVSNSDSRYNVAIEIIIQSKLLRAGQKAKVNIP